MRFMVPPLPKSAHRVPVAASSASSRPSRVGAKCARDRRLLRAGFIHPQRHAARDPVGVMQVLATVAVVTPAQGAADRIDRDDVGGRRGQIQRAVVKNGGGLEGRAVPVLHALAQLTGAEDPGLSQLGDIGGRDLCQRRVAGAAGITAIGRPAAIGGGRSQNGCDGARQNRHSPHHGRSPQAWVRDSRLDGLTPPAALGRSGAGLGRAALAG